jgi:taurine dioxygenase
MSRPRSLWRAPARLGALDGRQLLDLCYSYLERPEFTVRFRWAPGSVAFWDNRAAVHLGRGDLDQVDHDRRLHRVTLVGDVPVGVDGAPSVALEGDPFEARPERG